MMKRKEGRGRKCNGADRDQDKTIRPCRSITGHHIVDGTDTQSE
jgi:hypothetical protein